MDRSQRALRTEPEPDTDVLLVGGGVAGVATAYFLARAGTRVTLLEREEQLGSHSSGKNAAILRTLTPDPLLTELARESARFLDAPPPGFSEHPLIERTGLVLTAAESRAEDLASWARRGDSFSRAVELTPRELERLAPHYSGERALALHLPDEGRLDVAALLAGFARGARAAGARLCTGATVAELLVDGRSVRGVRTADGRELGARWTCLAAGGWAGVLGARAGSSVRLQPTRRHLAVTSHDPRIDPRGAVVWVSGDDFYCRPESGGWLLCPCDQVTVNPDDCTVDEGLLETLAAKTARNLAPFADAHASRVWCGLRTLTDDGRFCIGPDPDLEGLFWVAGLGGHGMVASAEIGRRAAEGLRRAEAAAGALAPGRLVATG